MPLIKDFDEIVNFLSTYVSECKKTEFKQHELSLNTDFEFQELETNNNTSENAIYFQLVSKLFLLHDMVSMGNKLMSKCLIKKMKSEDCSLFLEYFNEKDFKLIQNVICNLSDTKYVIALSNMSYEILDNLILSETITKAIWYKCRSPMIVITKNVYQVQNNKSGDRVIKSKPNNPEKDSKNFEAQLLQLISAVTNINKDCNPLQTYTFWVFKINSLMFGVLIPRFESEKNCLINVWPILPAASFFSANKAIGNLKILEKDKTIFYSIAASIKLNQKLNVFNLKNEMFNGITLPMLLQNRINIKTLYMTFFFEFLREKEHFLFPIPLSDCSVYLKCNHCNITFNNIFQFVRHWWVTKKIKIFRCHMCDERLMSLSKLASHYKKSHFNYLLSQKNQQPLENVQFNTNSTNELKIKLYKQNDVNLPKLRKCPLCDTYKEGLHYMRLHIRVQHISEIMKLSVVKMKENLPQYENNALDFSRPSIPIYSLDKYVPNFNRDQFVKLFKYNIMCPFCDDSFIKYSDSLTFLTHLARDHSNIKKEKYRYMHKKCKKRKPCVFKASMEDRSITSVSSTDKSNKISSSNKESSYFPNSSSKSNSGCKLDSSFVSSQLVLSDFVDNLNFSDKILLRNILSKNINEDLLKFNNGIRQGGESPVINENNNQINCSICDSSF